MLALEGLELLHQRVERVVGNLRVVEEVVPVFMPSNLVAQGIDAISEVHGSGNGGARIQGFSSSIVSGGSGVQRFRVQRSRDTT